MFYLHVVHEQGMVGSGRDNPDFDSILWIPVQELIIDKDLKIMNFIPLSIIVNLQTWEND